MKNQIASARQCLGKRFGLVWFGLDKMVGEEISEELTFEQRIDKL